MSKSESSKWHGSSASSAASLGFFGFLGWIGALIYFINMANGFWEVVLAVLQSFVWPAYLVYYVLLALGVN